MGGILVTGGAGFIGSQFVRRWLAADSQPLVNLDKLTYAGNLDSLADVQQSSSYVFVQGDVCDAVTVREILQQHQPRAIVHFAAESHVDRSIDGPADFLQTNVVGTCTLLDVAKGYWGGLDSTDQDQFRFLLVSTDEVYGSAPQETSFTEQTPYAPNSPYSASKAAAGHFVRAYGMTYGLPVLTTLCSNNYGPYQFPEKLIPLMILNALEGKPLPVYGDGRQVRDWLHVEDHCAALETVLESGTPGQAYHIGGECERTNLQVVEAVCQIVDRLCPHLPHAPCCSLVTNVKDRPGHDRRYSLDITKIRRELGWGPTIGFEAGLEQTVRWYLNHSAWVERITSGVYQRERLGHGAGSAATGQTP